MLVVFTLLYSYITLASNIELCMIIGILGLASFSQGIRSESILK